MWSHILQYKTIIIDYGFGFTGAAQVSVGSDGGCLWMLCKCVGCMHVTQWISHPHR